LDNQTIMAAALASIKTGELKVFDTQLAALYFGQSAQAVAMRPFIDSVDHFPGSVTADGQYVVIDATATDGNGAALLSELQALGLQGGASFGSMASGFMPVKQPSVTLEHLESRACKRVRHDDARRQRHHPGGHCATCR
jgi:hypothetical protein